MLAYGDFDPVPRDEGQVSGQVSIRMLFAREFYRTVAEQGPVVGQRVCGNPAPLAVALAGFFFLFFIRPGVWLNAVMGPGAFVKKVDQLLI